MRLVATLAGLLLAVTAQASESPASPPALICSGVSNAAEQEQCMVRAAAFTGESSTTSRPGLSFIWPFAWWIVYYGFGLIVGSYIYRDAKKRPWVFLGIRPIWWGLLAAFEPAIGLIAYWATHYSRLSQNYSEAMASESSAPTQP